MSATHTTTTPNSFPFMLIRTLVCVCATLPSIWAFYISRTTTTIGTVSNSWSCSTKYSSSFVSSSYYTTTLRHEPFVGCDDRTVVSMGKGDGKKKRKKKTSTTTTTPSSTPSSSTTTPTPQRVTNDINIPVRQQIRWAQQKKAALRSSGTAFRQTKRTAYRRSISEEEEEIARIQRSKRGQEPDWDVILNVTSVPPLMIVDGYNIVYKWARLKKWMNKGMLSKARDTLIYDLEELRIHKQWRIEVVFDGYGRNLHGPLGDGPGGSRHNDKIDRVQRLATKKVTDHGVRVVYSGAGTSADGYIEKRCAEAKAVTGGEMSGRLIVASDDGMIRTAALSAGALCMSADRMVDELKVVRKVTRFRVDAALKEVNGNLARPVALGSSSSSSGGGGGGSSSINNGEKVVMNPTTGRMRMMGSIVDNRDRKKKEKKKKKGVGSKTLEEVRGGTTGIPDWALTPEQRKQRIELMTAEREKVDDDEEEEDVTDGHKETDSSEGKDTR